MPRFRVMADVRVDMTQINNLIEHAPEAVLNGLNEVTGAAIQIAKDASRTDTYAMQKGWTRRRIGFKSAITANNETPGYRLYNNTVNKYNQTYTQYHEFGTSYIEAQPMLQPAADYINQHLAQVILESLEDAKDGNLSISFNMGSPNQVPMED